MVRYQGPRQATRRGKSDLSRPPLRPIGHSLGSQLMWRAPGELPRNSSSVGRRLAQVHLPLCHLPRTDRPLPQSASALGVLHTTAQFNCDGCRVIGNPKTNRPPLRHIRKATGQHPAPSACCNHRPRSCPFGPPCAGRRSDLVIYQCGHGSI